MMMRINNKIHNKSVRFVSVKGTVYSYIVDKRIVKIDTSKIFKTASNIMKNGI